MAVVDDVVTSDIPDLTQLSLTELREYDDEALRAGLTRITRRIRTTDDRLSTASRRLD
ncbi:MULTISPECIES: hypothetical protein [Pseudofrankia]|uniref:hypothetical protein n=1 Tax=Pseudofrankia TaxID=2994363 RepID=UPI000234C89E|nr:MULTISPECIES: hypothetical protein [Pseudofrankia]